MEYPKILIICHNLYDVTNNIGKTLVSLMDGYPKDKIAQLYFRNDAPSFQYCSNYYKTYSGKKVSNNYKYLHHNIIPFSFNNNY